MQSILAILFVIALTVFLIIKRKKVQVEKILFPVFYFVMYRTKLGIVYMDKIAQRLGGLLRFCASGIIAIGFIGMVFICVELLFTIYRVFTDPVTPAGVGIIQPFVPDVPGTVFVPFLYFIISIIVIAIIHEGSHGVMARAFKIKIKSSGFAFLSVVFPIIPAAFVEPDEKVMNKRPLKQQLAIFSAGPVSNIFTAVLVLALFALVLQPVVLAVADFEGIQVTGFPEGESPAKDIGIMPGELITAIDDHQLEDLSNFSAFLSPYLPGDTIDVVTDKSTYAITLISHPDNSSKAYLGISPKPKVGPSKEFVAQYGEPLTLFILWFIGLLFWIYLLSAGIGLFNLLPLGPVDGGRMFYIVLLHYLPAKQATKIFGYTSTFVLVVLALMIIGIIFF